MTSRKIGLAVIVVLGAFAIAALQRESSENTHNDVPVIAAPSSVDSDDPRDLEESNQSVGHQNDSESVEQSENRSPWVNTLEIDPGALYEKYILRATEGDIEATFVVVSAIRACRFVTRSEEEIDRNVTYYPQEVIDHQRRRLKNCESLYSQVSDPESEYDKWYQTIRSSGHPLFKVKQRSLAYEELKPLVIAALSEQYPRPYLYADAFGAAARMYFEYPEHGIDENKFHAWQLMTCSALVECDHNAMLSSLHSVLPKHQVDEIYALEKTYSESIIAGDLSMFEQ